MATYAIGDIQGCFWPFRTLLDVIHFDPVRDRLWFVGDLVNRGPDSLAVLRFVRSLGESGMTVLGNHDLHMLAVLAGITPPRRKDTFEDFFSAPDREELLQWIRCRPLLYQEKEFVLVHAGLLPSWTVGEALQRAREVEQVLRSDDYFALLRALYGEHSHEHQWSESLSGMRRLCTITNVLTRLRVCTPTGVMEFSYKGPPDHAPSGFIPWFQVPNRKSGSSFIIFGHWSAMGFRLQENLLALDTGCVWGGGLSAVRLEDRRTFHVPCAGRTT